MSSDLRPETQAKLEAIAVAHGLSADDYLDALVEREMLLASSSAAPTESAGGMIVEDSGLRIYRTGKPLTASFVDNAIRRSREDRALHILGDLH